MINQFWPINFISQNTGFKRVFPEGVATKKWNDSILLEIKMVRVEHGTQCCRIYSVLFFL